MINRDKHFKESASKNSDLDVADSDRQDLGYQEDDEGPNIASKLQNFLQKGDVEDDDIDLFKSPIKLRRFESQNIEADQVR